MKKCVVQNVKINMYQFFDILLTVSCVTNSIAIGTYTRNSRRRNVCIFVMSLLLYYFHDRFTVIKANSKHFCWQYHHTNRGTVDTFS